MLAEGTVAFTPDPGNTRLLRDAFGRFATGVTIVTTHSADGPVAVTASSFSSVSLTPPLVLWSADRGSRRFRFFEAADHYAIHVLSAEQDALCFEVAGDPAALQSSTLAVNDHGVPLLDGCLARFECTRHATYDGGDHAIMLGHVDTALMREDGNALTFYKGKLGQIAAMT